MTGPEPHPELSAWVARTTGGARVVRRTARPPAGGSVSGLVEAVTLHLSGGRDAPGTVRVVRKRASAHEAAGLETAQAVRQRAPAVPELIARGEDADGTWLITPYLPGAPMPDRGTAAPDRLFVSPAHLHARFRGAERVPAGLPRVDPRWWRELCRQWVVPGLERQRAKLPGDTLARAVETAGRAALHPGVRRTSERLPRTLLHGDVHPGNVLVDGRRARPIDWDSCRVGPALLDLANLVAPGSRSFGVHRQAWEHITGKTLDIGTTELGRRWAELQTCVQYLPWTAGNRTAAEVEAAVGRAERALDGL
ncbi:phosphotransferase family protein [Streptomyces sp. NPDC059785]|uniref:phosphotransferase family protein n=1 Tax=Streptomyces sp. NPDC059785 TaxID=3346945 RepID=UPI003662AE5E